MNDLIEFLFVPVAIIGIVLIKVLFSRTSALQEELEKIKHTISKAPHGARAANPAHPARPHAVRKSETHTPTEPGSFELFVKWIKEDWLMKLGALFVLLAIVWFVRYSFVNDWVGEMGRIAIGLVVGVGILAGGYSQLHKRPIPGQVLLVLGTTAILFTIYIARNSYDIFTPATALSIMAFTVVLIASVAVQNKSLSVAVTAILGGLAAPILSNSPESNMLFLNVYLFVLNCGVFAMVAIRGWRELLLVALIATGIYVQAGTFGAEMTDSMVWLFMALFYGLFFIGTSAAILSSKKIAISDIATIAITVLIGIYWVAQYIPEQWQSIVLAVAVIFAAIVNIISLKIGAPKLSSYLTGAAAIVLLGAATAFELEGTALVIAFSVEVAAVVAIIRYVVADTKATLISGLLQIVPIVLAFSSLDSWRRADLFNENFFVLLVVGLSLAATAFMTQGLIAHTEDVEKKEQINKVTIAHSVVSGIFLLAIIWRGLEVLVDSSSVAHGTALVIYTIVSLSLFFAGLSMEKKTIRLLGLIALVLVILRLVFIEIWDMALVARTITFIVIGILLITTAFFQKKSSDPHNQ